MQMVKFKNFSTPMGVFPVLFKANLFSRTFQYSIVYSSTFQARANPGVDDFFPHHLGGWVFLIIGSTGALVIIGQKVWEIDQHEHLRYHLGDNCIQNFHLGRYFIGYTVGNLVLRRRVRGAVKRYFRTYIWRYTSPNENFEYGYPHSNAL